MGVRDMAGVAAPGILGRVSRDPGGVALVHEGRDVTFGEVAALGEDVAEVVRGHELRGRVVGVPADRSPEFVARLFGVWGAGAVPAILGQWGAERSRAALAAAGAAAVFGPSSALTGLRSSGEVPAPLLPGVDLGEVSHVLFTSGTTGRPKGIVVGRVAFEAAGLAFFEELPVDGADRVAFLSRPGHDPSLRELMAPWVTGATLHIPDSGTASDPRLLAAWLREHSITVVQGTPVLLQLLAGSSPLPVESLRLVCSVGARLTAAALRSAVRFAPRAVIANCYGASETPQVVCVHRVPPGAGLAAEDPVPIGRPLGHVRVTVVPEAKLGVKGGDGGEGRLHVEAAACALGYTDGTPLLAPGPGGRLWYDTGDLVRRSPDGSLCFLARADRQVQVNGVRVELEEVEDAAGRAAGVVGAVATFAEDGSGVGAVRLSVVRGAGAVVDVEEVRAALVARLDPAVVPSAIEVRDAPPESHGWTSAPPEEDPDERLWRVVEDSARSVLGGSGRIDPDGGFFEAGFTSISLMRLVSEVSVRLGVEISPVLVFQYPTLRAFANYLRENLDEFH
ncbi:AMP-binding protein [Nonomuraea sp. MCN248]|uniref:AMP-binding protein n=1 Tax=Nonomuraea corallina TaxID=2989783 RepID=A0ABT4SFV8_9ACTN|nr:AMP-binding protein [Nonomuraea corallina]MDA0635913.1 AMP-binding protein [Nonomuraea corallina]